MSVAQNIVDFKGLENNLNVSSNIDLSELRKENPFAYRLQVTNSILGLVVRRKPLLVFTFSGLVFSVAGIIIGILVIQQYQETLELSLGLTIITSILTVFGFLLGITGILLHSISHFFDKLNKNIEFC